MFEQRPFFSPCAHQILAIWKSMSPLPPYGIDNHVHKRRKKLRHAMIVGFLLFDGVASWLLIPRLSTIRKTSEKQRRTLEPKMRIELTTYALRVRCSTPELPGPSNCHLTVEILLRNRQDWAATNHQGMKLCTQ
jgi:hypothetical protein